MSRKNITEIEFLQEVATNGCEGNVCNFCIYQEKDGECISKDALITKGDTKYVVFDTGVKEQAKKLLRTELE